MFAIQQMQLLGKGWQKGIYKNEEFSLQQGVKGKNRPGIVVPFKPVKL